MGDQICDRIRIARTRNGWTQEQVDGWCELPKGTVAQYELGTRKPASGAIRKLAVGLRVSADWLLGIEPQDPAV